MSRVLVVPLMAEVGHLNPTLALARALSRRGHSVRYLAHPRLCASIERQGFGVTALCPEVLVESLVAATGWTGFRADVGRYNALMASFLRGDLGKVFKELKPDVVLVDNMWPQIALVAHALGIPSMLLATTPGFRRRQPPVPWSLVPRLAALAGLELHAGTLELATRAGFSAANLDLGRVFPAFASSDVPELLLYPAALEEAGAAMDGVFAGPSVDVDRVEDPMDLSHVPDTDELIYCALGTRDVSARDALRVFTPAVEACGRWPRGHLLIAAGAHASLLRGQPPSVTVVERAPQLQVLRRARVMLTHGGLGSIKEALVAGVPMVVFPLRFDQEGNAQRVHEGRMGVSLKQGRRSATDILGAMHTVTAVPAYVARTAEMRQTMQALEDAGTAVDVVEDTIRRAGRRGRDALDGAA